MKKAILILCSICLSLSAFGAAGAAVITVEPLNSSQALGSTFDLTIVGSEFVDGTAGGGLDLMWDPSILNLNSVSLVFPSLFGGDPVWDFWSEGTIDNSTGTLSGLSVASFVGTSSTFFDIATLSFTAVGMGLSAIDLIVSSENVWPDYTGTFDVIPLAADGSVNVVPIPGALWLLGTGLIGLVGLSRRRRT